jgi:hypothetical protein
MAAKPTVKVSNAQDPFADEHGQRWSPAEITISWPPSAGLRPPSLKVEVVVPVRDEMTLEEYRAAVIANALDVMSAALLCLEDNPRPKQRRVAKSA